VIGIIGGKGFVGSAYVRWCERRKVEHLVITRENYAEHLGTNCTLLINANGSSSKLLAERDPLRDFDLAVGTVRNSLHDFKYRRYIYLSSCEVYPNCADTEATVEESPIDSRRQSHYGFHRYLAELCVKHVADEWLIFRMGGFTGPGLKKNAIFDILSGERLWLDPASELQFIGTDAAAEIVMTLAGASLSDELFNLCGDGTVRLADVADMAQRHPLAVPGAPCVRYQVSVNKLKRLIAVPRTSDTVHSFVQEYLRTSDSRR
jgi:nucleoside-diphosphate-sugar epimerase